MKHAVSIFSLFLLLLIASPAMASSARDIQARKARLDTLLKDYQAPKFEKVSKPRATTVRGTQTMRYDLHRATDEAMKICGNKGVDILSCVKTERDRLMVGGSAAPDSSSSASSSSSSATR